MLAEPRSNTAYGLHMLHLFAVYSELMQHATGNSCFLEIGEMNYVYR